MSKREKFIAGLVALAVSVGFWLTFGLLANYGGFCK